MPIEKVSEESGLVTIRATGKITVEDNLRFIEQAEPRIDAGGRYRVLIRLEGFEGWADGDWENEKLSRFPIEKGGAIEKIAFVGDPMWEQDCLAFVGYPLIQGREAKFFTEEETAEARAWVS